MCHPLSDESECALFAIAYATTFHMGSVPHLTNFVQDDYTNAWIQLDVTHGLEQQQLITKVK